MVCVNVSRYMDALLAVWYRYQFKQLAQEVQSGGGKTRAFLPIPNVDTQAQQRRGETHRS
ncbi:UNVERIFIED_CONTAM: hypothetical protein FKN15_070347 [Acipenser sinensis]